MTNLELEKTANEVRKSIVTAVHSAKAGHPGGSLSAADIFTYLYFEELNIDPKNPKMADRDRFVLSKGHTAPGLYAVLAERGFFPKEDLVTLRHTGSYLQGHPDMKHIPGIDMSSGSLGQGLSAAAGMAAAGKFDKKDYRVYALCGDGEIQEGQIWEAAMWAGFRKLDNLVVIVDNNNLQIDGTVDEVCSPYPIDKKFEAFNFHTININGNDFDEIRAAFKEARETKGMPTAIIAKTLKGKGVSFMGAMYGIGGMGSFDWGRYYDLIFIYPKTATAVDSHYEAIFDNFLKNFNYGPVYFALQNEETQRAQQIQLQGAMSRQQNAIRASQNLSATLSETSNIVNSAVQSHSQQMNHIIDHSTDGIRGVEYYHDTNGQTYQADVKYDHIYKKGSTFVGSSDGSLQLGPEWEELKK